MLDLNRLMAGKPFRKLAISIDGGGKEAVEDFIKRSGYKLPAFLAGDETISKLYDIT
jgi:hypothetical protein